MASEPNASAEPTPHLSQTQANREWLDERDSELRHWVQVLWSGRWWIVTTTVVALAIAAVNVLSSPTVYEANSLLRIEEKNATLSGMEGLEEITGGNPETSAQLEILRSRSVIGAAVDRLGLTIEAEPRRLPVFYALFADTDSDGPADPWLGLESYDWGGSEIDVGRLEVPSGFRGTPFTLVAQNGGRYQLLDPDGEPVLTGRTGQAATAEFGDGEVSLFVQTLVARPGTEFVVRKNSRLATIGDVRGRLSVRQRGQDTGVVEIKLEGHDRAQIRHTLATIADVYLRQNTQRRSAEARESLKFIESQLPELRQTVEQAESKLAKYQERRETVDLTVETEKLLGRLVELEQKISELQSKRAEALRSYGEEHPVIEAIDAQLETLRQEKKQLDERVGTLPDKQREMLSLKRELKVNTEVYTQMLNRAQQLRVAKAGAIGNVRIIDEAVVSGRVGPKTMRTMVLSLFLGGFAGCALVVLRRFFQRGVESPDELEQRTGLAVYAVVPHCRALLRGDRRYARGTRDHRPLLPVDAPEDPTTEALRSLRTSLHFGLRDPENRVIAIISPGPDAGKSTISVNLALLLAEIGQRVLVIDGDMRRGRLASYIRTAAPEGGLADVLGGRLAWRDVVCPLGESARAFVMTRGTTPPNPSELLLSDRFGELLTELRAAYDWVVIDATPVMAVTDGAIIAHEASATFMVARSARDDANEVLDGVRRLEHGGARVTGLILNDFGVEQAGRTYQTYYYRYGYESKKA